MNDIKEIKRLFTFARGERPATKNLILKLIEEIETLRAENALAKKANLELAKSLAELK